MKPIGHQTFAAFLATAVAVVATGGLAGCGGDDKKSNAQSLAGVATMTPLSANAPFEAQYKYRVKKSSGDVKVKWNFADGTTSESKSGTHLFKKPDWYAVSMVATDEAGHEDRWNFATRAHDPKEKGLQDLPKDPKKAKRAAAKLVIASASSYYDKYPSALPSNPNSAFYKSFPYLRKVWKKHRKLLSQRVKATKEYDKQFLKEHPEYRQEKKGSN